MSEGGPVLVQANRYQFGSGERIRHAHVASVCLVLCLSGAGTIRSGVQELRLHPGSIVRLPWGHAISYTADAREPFTVAAAHLLPWHTTTEPIVRRAAHDRDDTLFSSRDRAWPDGLEPFAALTAPVSRHRDDQAAAYVEYMVHLARDPQCDDAALRSAGRLGIDEAERLATTGPAPQLPAMLRRMTAFIDENLDCSLTVDDIARRGGCSRATAERAFTKHFGMPVQSYVQGRRMTAAGRLLSETGLSVTEVAGVVGYSDPAYFSRVFSRVFGVSPRAYARGIAPL
ncbi:helix-turn-helix domain-containing protein [Leifsonia sp. ZF2019]|uniref:AraC family transcriptional regulator n=1 Tax=Leifsonia sp. ZF2019 TaxID=2781978 RepID=UPI001CBBF686|nr:AraC family transcriptional regulator [Leifsonia sp. ZF2019]UAJ79517.1 helix-turn-helix domain-containing protein [Leifsonia sp. ZF2019]